MLKKMMKNQEENDENNPIPETPKVAPVVIKQAVFENQADTGFDDDDFDNLDDFSNDNNNNNNMGGGAVKQDMKNTVSNYFKKLRDKDKKLFKFTPTKKHKAAYTVNCGAVEMRQPIILTKRELENFEKKNPEAYREFDNTQRKIAWASSPAMDLNYYICPRIWCIRDKIALTDDQLIQNDGRCPFCEGEIIDSHNKEIGENETVIIRKTGTNKYWADDQIKKEKEETEEGQEWLDYLEGTEKTAYPIS